MNYPDGELWIVGYAATGEFCDEAGGATVGEAVGTRIIAFKWVQEHLPSREILLL